MKASRCGCHTNSQQLLLFMKDQKAEMRAENCRLPGMPQPAQSRLTAVVAVCNWSTQGSITEQGGESKEMCCVMDLEPGKSKIREVGSRVFSMGHPKMAMREQERPDKTDLGWGCTSLMKCVL